jgi:hypothetical protein
MTPSTPAQRLEQVIRTYIQACNDGDEKAIAACFVAEAVHYFPSLPKWVGAATIGSNFARRVREQGHSWTLDQFVIDGDRYAATLEWTRFDGQGRILRGSGLVCLRAADIAYSGGPSIHGGPDPSGRDTAKN